MERDIRELNTNGKFSIGFIGGFSTLKRSLHQLVNITGTSATLSRTKIFSLCDLIFELLCLCLQHKY